jgi:hypothetical protein
MVTRDPLDLPLLCIDIVSKLTHQQSTIFCKYFIIINAQAIFLYYFTKTFRYFETLRRVPHQIWPSGDLSCNFKDKYYH